MHGAEGLNKFWWRKVHKLQKVFWRPFEESQELGLSRIGAGRVKKVFTLN